MQLSTVNFGQIFYQIFRLAITAIICYNEYSSKRDSNKEDTTMKITIIHEFPRLVSKPKHGFYMVTAIHSDGTTHSKGYTAMSSTEAKYRFLVEFGKVRGEIQTKFLPTP